MGRSKRIEVECSACDYHGVVFRPAAPSDYPEGMLWICPACRTPNTVAV